jgi:hypothetical protein
LRFSEAIDVPPEATSGGRTFLRFRRWLSVDDWSSGLDRAEVRILTEGSPDPILVDTLWRNHRWSVHVDSAVSAGVWVLVDIEISPVINELDSFYVEWGLETNTGGTEFGGWNIDDVEVFTIHNP